MEKVDIAYVLVRKADYSIEMSTSNDALAWAKYAEMKNIMMMIIFMNGVRIAHTAV